MAFIQLKWCVIGVYPISTTLSPHTQEPEPELTNHMRAIVLIVRLAKFALQARLDLSTNANTISNLELCDLITDGNNSTDDFVTDAEWCYAEFAPASGDGVDIGTANTAALVDGINIMRFEVLGGELPLLEITPFLGVANHIAFELGWSCHLVGSVIFDWCQLFGNHLIS
jgi:hypothetical protein